MNVPPGNYKVEQKGFGWILFFAVAVIGGLILWLFMTGRDKVGEAADAVKNGAIGKTVANNLTGFVGGIWTGIKDAWKGNPSTPTALTPTVTPSSDQAETTLGLSTDETDISDMSGGYAEYLATGDLRYLATPTN